MPIEVPIELKSVDGEEVVMSITETTNKIYKLGLYDKVVNNLVHDRRWRKTIEEDLQNLKSHQT